MKKINILLFVFTTLTLLCQTAPNILWTRTFGGGGGYSVKQTSDNGYIISGSSNGSTFLIKTNTNGDSLWTNTFPGTYGGHGRSVQQTSDGGFAVIRRDGLIKTYADGTYQWDREFYGSQLYSMQQTNDSGYILAGKNMGLIKTDEFGNEEWNRGYFGGSGSIAYDVKQTSDNGYVVAGTRDNSGWQIVLIKTDELGNEEWNVQVGEYGFYNYGFSVDLTYDEGYILSGSKYRGDEESSYDIFLLKTNALGEVIWTETYEEVGVQFGESVISIENGYVIACTNGEGPLLSTFLMRTDLYGNIIWQLDLNGDSNNHSIEVQQTEDQGFIVVQQSLISSDIMIVKIESEFRAKFSGNPLLGYNQLEVNFTDESPGNPINWQWDFQNDGVFDSNEQNPTYTYNEVGYYIVKLVVGDGTTIDTLIINNYVSVQYAPPATPTNIDVNVVGDDAMITWAEVDTTIFGDPIDIDYYIILYSEWTVPDSAFFYLGVTTETTFNHSMVAMFRETMFYKVQSFVGTRQELDRYVERYKGKPENDLIEELK